MRTLIAISTLLPALALAAGCDPVLYSAEIDAPEVCLGGMTLPFAPAALGDLGEQTISGDAEQTISGDDLGIGDVEGLDISLKVKSLGLMPMTDMADLSFIQSLKVSAGSAELDSGLPDIALVEMGDEDHRDDGSILVEPANSPDLAPLFEVGDVRLAAELTGELPDVVWQTRMELCVHVAASYREPL